MLAIDSRLGLVMSCLQRNDMSRLLVCGVILSAVGEGGGTAGSECPEKVVTRFVFSDVMLDL